ncbi:MAG: haloacid dehalogenase-like hydrolase [Bacilli bacterium]|nr:haloacid dehalogenase-like hydrolase [Bacilli bacterium]
MSNIIAVIWDFDKTLVNGYMQDPIFEEYNINPKEFWEEVNSLPEKYRKEQDVKVNPETIYLNQFIKYAKNGKFKGLNNDKLKEAGKRLKFYNGIPEIFEKTKKSIEDNLKYQEFDVKVEHYIVSTGITQVIKGSVVNEHVESIWGCEFIEDVLEENSDEKIISEVGFTIDNTTKTRALFEINKGVNKREEVEVNTKIPDNLRRVPFSNMIYIADGPSDIPAFSVVKKNGGKTFAIYPKDDLKAFKQVEQLRNDDRIDMYAEADYSEGTTTYLWINYKIQEIAERIYHTEKNKISNSISSAPKHIT